MCSVAIWLNLKRLSLIINYFFEIIFLKYKKYFYFQNNSWFSSSHPPKMSFIYIWMKKYFHKWFDWMFEWVLRGQGESYGFNDIGRSPKNSFYLIVGFIMQSTIKLMVFIFLNMLCVSLRFEWELNNFNITSRLNLSLRQKNIFLYWKDWQKACNEVLRPSFYAHKHQMILLRPTQAFSLPSATCFACEW